MSWGCRHHRIEGGIGGRLGRRQMEHRRSGEFVKEVSRVARRLSGKQAVREGLAEWHQEQRERPGELHDEGRHARSGCAQERQERPAA